MLLGFARGKVGSLVFSRANGQQITRAKADTIRNPKTIAQYIQRIILNTVSQAYSRMSSICDHSFEGIPVGQKSMSKFLKLNMDNLRKRLSDAQAAGTPFDEVYNFTPLGANYFSTNEYVVSSGQLPKISPVAPTAQTAGISDVYSIAENTYQAVLDAFGLQRGDQITFVQMDAASGLFRYARVILDPKETDGTDAPLSTSFITPAEGTGNYKGTITKPNPRNEGTFNYLVFDTNKFALRLPIIQVSAGACIASRQQADGTWLRSDSIMVSHESAEENHSGYSLAGAIDESMYGLSVESDRYLNNADNRANFQ